MADSGSKVARGMGAARKGGKYSVFKKGGKVGHPDIAEDKKLIKAEIGKAMKKETAAEAKPFAKGGSVARGMGCTSKGGNYTIT